MTGGHRSRLLLLVPLLAGPSAFWGQASGAAPMTEGFAAVASAQGGRLTFSVPGFAVVEDVIDGGGPVAQAAADAGGSRGFASLPYPGESAIAFPGLFNAVTGHPFPGSYPFYVVASHPTQPEQEVADPTRAYRLRATAGEGVAGGQAQLAGTAGSGPQSGSGGSLAMASVQREGDSVIAAAETRQEALQFGHGALRIASVRSLSSTTYRFGAPGSQTRTELVVDGGSAGGYTFGYGPNGLVVAGGGVPIPAGQGLAQLNQALAPAGLTLRIVDGDASPDGGSADTLEIKLAGALPIPGTPPGVIRLRFGGASSSVSVGQSIGLGDIGGPVGDPAPEGLPPEPAGGSPDAGAAGTPPGPPVFTPDQSVAGSPVGQDAGPGRAGGFAGLRGTEPAAVATGAPPAGPGRASVASAEGVAASAIPIVQPRRLRADGFVYGALLLSAIALLVVAGLWRAKGVTAS